MYDISCEMCMDLLPLVRDGAASPDSREAVEHHLKTCAVCRSLCQGETPPEEDEKKALSKVMGKLRMIGLVLLAAGLLLGICLTERLISGSSAVFVLIVFLIGWLLRFAYTKGSGIRNRVLRGLAFAAAAALAGGILLLSSALMGNPVSRYLAEAGAEEYLTEQYPGTDYRVDRVLYDFKTGSYRAEVVSPSSIDTHFELKLDLRGNMEYDDYDECVANGMNTTNRVDKAYRDLVDPILQRLNLDYTLHIGYGEIAFSETEPELDKEYDLQELGAREGKLIVYIRDDTVTEERAAEILLDVKALMDENGATFHSIHFVLVHPSPGEGIAPPEGQVEALDFLYEDIYQEGLAERLRQASLEAAAYWAELNGN